MSDPVQMLLELIRRDDAATVETLGDGLRGFMNSRNINIFWRAIIDAADKSVSTKGDRAHLGMMRAFVRQKLPLNACLDNGELPINMALSRSAGLGKLMLSELPVDVNMADKSGNTPALHCLGLTRTMSIHAMDPVVAMVARGDFDLRAKDQGSAICFKALSSLAIAAAADDENKLAIWPAKLLSALAAKGFDLNAARETPDATIGSTINTPLAYCIKKTAQWLEWNGHSKKSKRVVDAIAAITFDFIKLGADPCLQMEPGRHVELMEICRKYEFAPGMVEALEAGILRQSLASVKPPSQTPSSKRL
jgi:hypothetical protein